MEYKLQTLNEGEIDVGYLDNSTKKVRIGDLTIPTGKFIGFVGELIRNKNCKRVISTEEGDITGILEYLGLFKPKKVIFGDYEIRGGDFGALAEKLISEGTSMDMGEI